MMVAPVLAQPVLAQCPDGAPPPCNVPTRAAPPPTGSIAVLPFANRSPDSGDAYLADALPEQITGRLARVENLKVKSATVVSAQWRRTPDAMAAARALHVEWFVAASIRRTGHQLAVSAELVRASTGDGAWGGSFHRPDDDLAAVEEQLAESVAVAIVGRLAPTELAVLRRTPSRNPDAYRLYLYGRTLLTRRTLPDIGAAVDSLRRAVALDPGFAGAWARLGFARSLQVQWGSPEGFGRDSLLAMARAAAGRALALDSTSADGWLARGAPQFLTGDLASAHVSLLRAATLDSLNVDALNGLGYLYSSDLLDLPEAGAKFYRRILAVDPDYRNAWRHLGLMAMSRDSLAEAEALLDTTQSVGPWSIGLQERAFVRYCRGDGAGAVADLEMAQRLYSSEMISIPLFRAPLPLQHALYRTAVGDSTPARAALAALEARADSGRASWPFVAMLRMALGNRSGALEAIARLRATPDSTEPRCGAGACSTSLRTWRLLHNPLFRPLWTDPRFQQLLTETQPRVPWLE